LVAVVALCVVVGLSLRAVLRSGRGPAPLAPSDSPLSGEQAYQRLIRCSALITSPRGVGTGFVVDAERRLVVTNFHVVGRERQVVVVFPRYDAHGELVTDLRKYEQDPASGVGTGEVVGVDESCDLALVRVNRLAERTTAAPLAKQPAATGSVVYSVGGSGAADNLLWRLTKGNVRGRVQRQTKIESGEINCTILETDAPVNRGDSGGAVMNEHGEVVAVVSHGHVMERQVSGNIDVEEVRKFVARHQ
jgi:S1-C subfamily serine protease